MGFWDKSNDAYNLEKNSIFELVSNKYIAEIESRIEKSECESPKSLYSSCYMPIGLGEFPDFISDKVTCKILTKCGEDNP